MSYYLIDENEIRSRFENIIVYKRITNLSVKVHDVEYVVDDQKLDVIYATPLNENAFVPTTNGLINRKNYYVKITVGNDNVYKEDKTIRNFNYISVFYDVFCSGFICLGKTPSENALKITANNIRLDASKKGLKGDKIVRA